MKQPLVSSYSLLLLEIGNKYSKAAIEYIQHKKADHQQFHQNDDYVVISAKLEEEASQFEDEQSQLEYLQLNNVEETGIQKV